jgi:HEPN domain-containing protein
MQQRENLDLARTLLAKAIEDQTLVRKVAGDPEIADAIWAYGQQAVEKLIKAVLAARGVAFAKSHDLEYLIDLVTQAGIEAPEELEGAQDLSPWAAEFRYEGDDPPALDRQATLTRVVGLRIWSEKEIEAAANSPGVVGEQQTDQA